MLVSQLLTVIQADWKKDSAEVHATDCGVALRKAQHIPLGTEGGFSEELTSDLNPGFWQRLNHFISKKGLGLIFSKCRCPPNPFDWVQWRLKFQSSKEVACHCHIFLRQVLGRVTPQNLELWDQLRWLLLYPKGCSRNQHPSLAFTDKINTSQARFSSALSSD